MPYCLKSYRVYNNRNADCCVSLSELLDCKHKSLHIHIGCICNSSHQCASAYVSSKYLPEKRHSHTCCICRVFLWCVSVYGFSGVPFESKKSYSVRIWRAFLFQDSFFHWHSFLHLYSLHWSSHCQESVNVLILLCTFWCVFPCDFSKLCQITDSFKKAFLSVVNEKWKWNEFCHRKSIKTSQYTTNITIYLRPPHPAPLENAPRRTYLIDTLRIAYMRVAYMRIAYMRIAFMRIAYMRIAYMRIA